MGYEYLYRYSREQSLSLAWAQTICLIVFWAAVVIVGVLFYRRRGHPLIASRSPMLVLLFCACAVWSAIIIDYSVLWRPYLPCETGPTKLVLYVLMSIGFLGIFSSVLWRLCVLIEKFEAQRIRLAARLREDGFTTPFENNFFQRNIGLLTSRPVAAGLIVFTIIPPFLSLAATGGKVTFATQDPSSDCFASDEIVQYSYLVLTVAILGLAWKIRTDVQDGFGIVREFKQLGCVAMFYIITSLSVAALRPTWVGSVTNLFYNAILICGTCFWVALVIPLYNSYQSATKRTAPVKRQYTKLLHHHKSVRGSVMDIPSPSGAPPASGGGGGGAMIEASMSGGGGSAVGAMSISDEFKTLDDLLKSAPGRRAFEKHLALEFAIESLLFLDEVDALHRLKPDPATNKVSVESAREAATAIYFKFVGLRATHEINIAAATANPLHALFAPAANARANGGPNPSSRGLGYRLSQHTLGALARHAAAAGASAAVSVTSRNGAEASANSASGQTVATASGQLQRLNSAARPPHRSAAERKSDVAEASTAIPAASAPSPAFGITITDASDPHSAEFYLSVFDAARKEVHRLVSTDSFPRFVTSNLYEELLQNVATANELATIASPESPPLVSPSPGTGTGTGTGAAPVPSQPPTGQ